MRCFIYRSIETQSWSPQAEAAANLPAFCLLLSDSPVKWTSAVFRRLCHSPNASKHLQKVKPKYLSVKSINQLCLLCIHINEISECKLPRRSKMLMYDRKGGHIVSGFHIEECAKIIFRQITMIHYTSQIIHLTYSSDILLIHPFTMFLNIEVELFFYIRK